MSTDEWIPLNEEQKLRSFICACCRLVEHKLPPIAKEAIQLSEHYNQGLVDERALNIHSHKLWLYLAAQEKVLDSNARNELDSAVRAGLMCLFGRIDMHEAIEIVEWGTLFCGRLEKTEQTKLFNQICGEDFWLRVQAAVENDQSA